MAIKNLGRVVGADGKSAYQIWLENGNEGTEQDFLNSFKGQDGEQGTQGEQGIQGEKGDTGATGEKGENGKSAYQYAQEGGYEGTEDKFYKDLASISTLDEIIDNINGEVV